MSISYARPADPQAQPDQALRFFGEVLCRWVQSTGASMAASPVGEEAVEGVIQALRDGANPRLMFREEGPARPSPVHPSRVPASLPPLLARLHTQGWVPPTDLVLAMVNARGLTCVSSWVFVMRVWPDAAQAWLATKASIAPFKEINPFLAILEARPLAHEVRETLWAAASSHPQAAVWKEQALQQHPLHALVRAAAEGDVLDEAQQEAWVQRLVNWGVRINGRNDRGESPLALSVDADQFMASESIRCTLLRQGGHPSVKDQERTPLLVQAIRHSAFKLRDALLAAGVKPNLRDEEERTALHWAVSSMDMGSVQALLAAGADPNLRDAGHRTPFEWILNRRELHCWDLEDIEPATYAITQALILSGARMNQVYAHMNAEAPSSLMDAFDKFPKVQDWLMGLMATVEQQRCLKRALPRAPTSPRRSRI